MAEKFVIIDGENGEIQLGSGGNGTSKIVAPQSANDRIFSLPDKDGGTLVTQDELANAGSVPPMPDSDDGVYGIKNKVWTKVEVAPSSGGGGVTQLDIYSTEEVKTNKVHLGKPVYRKLISVNDLTKSTYVSVPHGLTGVTFLGCEMYLKSPEISARVGFVANGECQASVSTTNITYRIYGWSYRIDADFVLEYIKVADSPITSSPAAGSAVVPGNGNLVFVDKHLFGYGNGVKKSFALTGPSPIEFVRMIDSIYIGSSQVYSFDRKNCLSGGLSTWGNGADFSIAAQTTVTNPVGTTADVVKMTFTSTVGRCSKSHGLASGKTGIFSVYLKADTPTQIWLGVNNGSSWASGPGALCFVTTEWQRFILNIPTSQSLVLISTADPTSPSLAGLPATSIYAWGTQTEENLTIPTDVMSPGASAPKSYDQNGNTINFVAAPVSAATLRWSGEYATATSEQLVNFDLYLNEEVKTNKIYLGKPVYRKVMTVTNLTRGAITRFSHGITGYEKFTACSMSLRIDPSSKNCAFVAYSPNDDCQVSAGPDFIEYKVYPWPVQVDGEFVLEYTKTADTPFTPTSSGLIESQKYFTNEFDTGATWIDGKRIYRKVVDCGALPNNATKTVAHGVIGATAFVKISGMAVSGTTSMPMPFAAPNSTTYDIGLWVDGPNIAISSGTNLSSYSGMAILEYTK